jgi:uncharacterized protein YcbK (DUF882 family)
LNDTPSSGRTVARHVRRGLCALLLGGVASIAASDGTQNAQANGDTRSLTLYHTHRGDTVTVTFKRNGRYDADGLKQLSYFLRDWRNDKQTRMEPKLFDIVWEVHRQVGRGGMINIVSSYRSPETNAYLRARSSGVAKFSQHMLGRAMDFYITGVPVSSVREAGIRLQRGGVGFYPTSGRPFVHLDAGSIRAWPRMSRSQLARIFPGGKTVHQPAEGGQMPGYQLAAAELRSRGEVSLDNAYAGGGSSSSSSGKSFFARLFGGADESEDEASTQVAAAPARGAASSSSAGDDEGGAAAPAPTRVATVKVTPMPMARPADMVRPSAPAAQQAEVAVAAAVVPMPPIAPARPAQAAQAQIAMASAVPLPPVAPTVVAAKPVPLPPSAPSDGYQLASAEPAGPKMAWQTGAQPMSGQPVQASEPALALASTIPTPKPRPTPDSAIAVLAALPAPTAEQKPREIDPNAASAYQAEASTFPRLPDAFLGKRRVNESGEMSLAYASPAVSAGVAQTRAAVAPHTKVTAAVPTDPNVRVLSPYATPAAVYAAATAPMRRRATLTAEPMVSTPLDEASYAAFLTEARTEYSMEMHPPAHAATLFVQPTAALAGGFTTAAVVGARCDKFQGSSVMLLRTQSFMTGDNLASKPTRQHG